MISALVKGNYQSQQNELTADRLAFWLTQASTPERLVQLASRFPARTDRIQKNLKSSDEMSPANVRAATKNREPRTPLIDTPVRSPAFSPHISSACEGSEADVA